MLLLLLLGQALWECSHLGSLSCAQLRNYKLLLLIPVGGVDLTILIIFIYKLTLVVIYKSRYYSINDATQILPKTLSD